MTLKDWIEVAKLVGIPLALALGFAYAMIKRFIVTGQELATTEKKCSDEVTAVRSEHEKRVVELRRLYEARFTEAVSVRDTRMADLRSDYEARLVEQQRNAEARLADCAKSRDEWRTRAEHYIDLTSQAASITEAAVTVARRNRGTP